MLKKIKKFTDSTKFEVLIVLAILFGAFLVRLYKVDSPIADWHSWRQVDTASVARIYVNEGIDLLYPKYYDISSIQTGRFNPEGLRFVEFPLYNLVHAVAFKTVPQIGFEVWGRLISILASIISAICIYLLGKRLVNKLTGFFSLFFFSFIPFSVYYSRVILPEPITTMFAVLSILLFVKYFDTDKKIYLFTAAVSFSLSLLIKPYTIFYALPIVYLSIKKFGFKGIFKNIPLLLALDIALIPVIAWRGWINTSHNLVGIPHLAWAFNGDGIRFKPSFWNWIFAERLGKLILGMWGLILFGFGIVTRTKLKVIEIMGIGMLLYVVIVATASVRHDYYQSIAIPVIVLILGLGASRMWTENWRGKALLVFCVFMMFLTGYYQVKEFYKVNHPEFITIGKIVDESLPKDAKIIVPDNGNTVFLYYTNRRGWPVLETSIDEVRAIGAQYFVSVNNDADTNMLKNKFNMFKEGPNYWIIDLTKPK